MRPLRGWMAVPVAVLLLAGGVWCVSAGWILHEVSRDTVAAHEFGHVRPAEVVAHERVGGVPVDVLRVDARSFRTDRRVLASSERAPVGEEIEVRTVLVSASAPQVPDRRPFATAHPDVTAGARVTWVGRWARLLLFAGLLATPLGGLLLATGLRLLTADPKRQTVPYAPSAP
ncbi:MAG: hypothetical protein KY457_08390 [Actinobacteria bacterium]|nr:hypothetical protein [Actinomycetota bacterium]